MSKSKRTPTETLAPSAKKKTGPFRSGDNRIRTGWLLAASLFGYALAALGLRYGLGLGFGALFRAWGINGETVGRAPSWARALYAWHGSLAAAVADVAALLVCRALRRMWLERPRKPRFFPGQLLRGALRGLVAALAVALVCLLPDSDRLQWSLSAPRLSWRLVPLCALSLLDVLAEEAFTKRVLYDGLRKRWGARRATAVACAAFLLADGGFAAMTPISALNVLLLGLVGCLLYARYGFWAASGFRWGWGLAMAFVMGFGGGDAALYRIYGVSETLLTGGDGGPMYGLWTTVMLAGLLLFAGRTGKASRR